ncbi:MAG: hypothetical protein RLZZ127_1045, partial [Planctomycetota bacterium]
LYRAQVANGGHSQFIYNAWTPATAALVAAGLERHAPPAYAEHFARVRARVEALGDDLEAFRSGSYFGDDSPWLKDLAEADEAYFALERSDGGLVARLHAAIARLPGLEVVPDAEYTARMEPFLALDEARRLEKDRLIAKALEEEDDDQKALRRWAKDLGLGELEWGPAWVEDAAGEQVMVISFVCGEEGHQARFSAMHVRLSRGDGTVLGVRPTGAGAAVGSWCTARGLDGPAWTGVVPLPPGAEGVTAHGFTAGANGFIAVSGGETLSIWDRDGRCLEPTWPPRGKPGTPPAMARPHRRTPREPAEASAGLPVWAWVVIAILVLAVLRALV